MWRTLWEGTFLFSNQDLQPASYRFFKITYTDAFSYIQLSTLHKARTVGVSIIGVEELVGCNASCPISQDDDWQLVGCWLWIRYMSGCVWAQYTIYTVWPTDTTRTVITLPTSVITVKWGASLIKLKLLVFQLDMSKEEKIIKKIALVRFDARFQALVWTDLWATMLKIGQSLANNGFYLEITQLILQPEMKWLYIFLVCVRSI